MVINLIEITGRVNQMWNSNSLKSDVANYLIITKKSISDVETNLIVIMKSKSDVVIHLIGIIICINQMWKFI